MDFDDDDLYGQDEPRTSNSVGQDGHPSGAMKMEDLEEGEEEGEEVEGEDSDDVSLSRHVSCSANINRRTTSILSPIQSKLPKLN